MLGYVIAFAVGIVLARWKRGRQFALKWGVYALAVVGALAVLAVLV